MARSSTSHIMGIVPWCPGVPPALFTHCKNTFRLRSAYCWMSNTLSSGRGVPTCRATPSSSARRQHTGVVASRNPGSTSKPSLGEVSDHRRAGAALIGASGTERRYSLHGAESTHPAAVLPLASLAPGAKSSPDHRPARALPHSRALARCGCSQPRHSRFCAEPAPARPLGTAPSCSRIRARLRRTRCYDLASDRRAWQQYGRLGAATAYELPRDLSNRIRYYLVRCTDGACSCRFKA